MASGWLRDVQIVQYGAAHQQLRDRQIMSPVVPPTMTPRLTSQSETPGSSHAGYLTSYSPQGHMFAVTIYKINDTESDR
jgi:hypothetical protein